MYFLIPLGVVSLAGVIYLAVSKKSSFKLRVAALIALALMIITVIICMVQIFGTPVVTAVPAYPGLPITNPPEVQESNSGVLIVFIIILILLFAAVVYLAIKEHRQAQKGKVDLISSKNWE